VTANVSNTIGLVPGSLSGAYGYRRELRGQRDRAVRFGLASLCGGVCGAVLLLVLPAAAFKAIVPVFIALALILVVLQPRISRRLADRGTGSWHEGGALPILAVCLTGVYGGYFGAAQGILLFGVLGPALPQSLQRTNALKNLLTAIVNGIAGVFFVFATHVAWGPAVTIAGSSLVGGQIGAHLGRRLPPSTLRGLIVVVGIVAIVRLLV
jgi:uncharacterized membrane protein YfcA